MAAKKTENNCWKKLQLFWKEYFYAILLPSDRMVAIAQLVRASDCGSEGRRFEPG